MIIFHSTLIKKKNSLDLANPDVLKLLEIEKTKKIQEIFESFYLDCF